MHESIDLVKRLGSRMNNSDIEFSLPSAIRNGEKEITHSNDSR